jgi:site-specific recombinase XerD
MLLKDFHLKFLDYLEVIQNKSPRTVEQYDRHINKFNEYLEEKNIDSYKFNMEQIDLELAE